MDITTVYLKFYKVSNHLKKPVTSFLTEYFIVVNILKSNSNSGLPSQLSGANYLATEAFIIYIISCFLISI